MKCTIYQNIFNKDNPFVIDISKALHRIKTGASKDKVLEIRQQLDKERANSLKKNLPCVLF
jgi:hypothetical protein